MDEGQFGKDAEGSRIKVGEKEFTVDEGQFGKDAEQYLGKAITPGRKAEPQPTVQSATKDEWSDAARKAALEARRSGSSGKKEEPKRESEEVPLDKGSRIKVGEKEFTVVEADESGEEQTLWVREKGSKKVRALTNSEIDQIRKA